MLVMFLLYYFLVVLPQRTESSDMSPRLWFEVNPVPQNEVPAKIAAKIDEDLTIPCLMKYELTYFAWFLCQSDCRSPDAGRIVVKIDNGSKSISDENKFGLDSNGSLVLKKIYPENNNNWVRCFYKESLVGTYHRSTIILIDIEKPTITMKGEKEHFVFERMPLFLDCGARGYPVPSVAWSWDDQVLQNSTDEPQFLLRRRVTTKEAGNYTCMARNSLGVAKYTYQVTVKVDDPTRESKSTSGTHPTVIPTTIMMSEDASENVTVIPTTIMMSEDASENVTVIPTTTPEDVSENATASSRIPITTKPAPGAICEDPTGYTASTFVLLAFCVLFGGYAAYRMWCDYRKKNPAADLYSVRIVTN